MKDILDVLSAGSWLAYLALVLSVLPLIAKGLFAMRTSRSRERKEFLELWRDGDKSDDFWLELMIRHCFGATLPASLVRRVIQLPESPARLTALASEWSWFVYDASTGQLDWKSEWRRVQMRNTFDLWLCRLAYVFFAFLGMLIVQTRPTHSVPFIFGIFSLAIAFASLIHSLNLDFASGVLKKMRCLLPDM